jgi:cellulose biosynthesis protein BcsQ
MSGVFVIAIANQKGGVAKTTTVVSLGGALVNQGKEVLLIDLDAQANLTLALGKEPSSLHGVISDVFFNTVSLASITRETSIPGLDLIASNAEMDTAERFLPLRQHHEVILRQALHSSIASSSGEASGRAESQILEQSASHNLPSGASGASGDSAASTSNDPFIPHEEIIPSLETDRNPITAQRSSLPYDFVLIDCPPFIGAVTMNALIAADMLIIPTQPEFFSAHALRTMMITIKQVRKQHNPSLVYRILVTMLDRRNRIHRQVNEQIQQTFKDGVFNNRIEVDTRLRESAVHGLPIGYFTNSRSAQQYDALAQEIISYVESAS